MTTMMSQKILPKKMPLSRLADCKQRLGEKEKVGKHRHSRDANQR